MLPGCMLHDMYSEKGMKVASFTLLCFMLCGVPEQCMADKFWVKPTHHSDIACPEPCHTLSEYLQDTAAYFTSNTTVHFFPVIYTLNLSRNGSIIVRDISEFSLIGNWLVGMSISNSSLRTVIQCIGRNNFVFINITQLHVAGIGFVNCGFNITSHEPGVLRQEHDLGLWDWSLDNAHAALLFLRVSNLVLEQVVVNESHGFGLLAIDLVGTVIVKDCNFYCNNAASSGCEFETDSSIEGGNAAFLSDPIDSNIGTLSLEIHNTVFAYGTHYEHHHDRGRWNNIGGGLTIHTENRVLTSVSVYVCNCLFHRNNGPNGGGMLVFHMGGKITNFSLTILNSTFKDGNAKHEGGGLYVNLYSCICGLFSTGHQVINISSCKFYNNHAHKGGGVWIHSPPSSRGVNRELTVNKCTFANNSGYSGSAMNIILCLWNVGRQGRQAERLSNSWTSTPRTSVHIFKCVFKSNFAFSTGSVQIDWCNDTSLFPNTDFDNNICVIAKSLFIGNSAKLGSALSIEIPGNVTDSMFINNWNSDFDCTCAVLYLNLSKCYSVHHLTLSNSNFTDNRCSAIQAYGSKITLQGSVIFKNNSGVQVVC